MIIKAILITTSLALLLYGLRGRMSGSRLALRRLAGTAVVILGIVAVLFPDSVTTIANWVGVGRGTDLLLYVLVMTFLFAITALYQRLHAIEQDLACLTRELALAKQEQRDPT